MKPEQHREHALRASEIISDLINTERTVESFYDCPGRVQDQQIGRLLVIFVHGLNSSKKVWGDFFDLIRGDNDLSRFCDIAEFGYPTSLFGGLFKKTPRVELIAEGLGTTIEDQHRGHFEIALVGHSLGGLVARHYIVHMLKHGRKSRVRHLWLYATPNLGADLANFGWPMFPWNSHLRALGTKSEFIRRLNEDWNALEANKHVRVTYVIGGRDRLVSEGSAKHYWGNDCCKVVADRDHFSIVKPQHREDLIYSILKNGLMRAWHEVGLSPG